MRETISRNWRIITAAFFAVIFIAGSYLVAREAESPQVVEASTEVALLQAIATKDSNGDGLPDWEKALYGIPLDATTTDYFHLGMTDGEAAARGLIVPKAVSDIQIATSNVSTSSIDYAALGLEPPNQDSLTSAFAKNFFTSYLAAKQQSGGTTLSDTDIQNIMSDTVGSLFSTIGSVPDFKTLADIKTLSDSSEETYRAYAANVEAVLKRNKSDATKNALFYLIDEVQNNDSTIAPEHLASLAKAYRDSAVGIAALPVPINLAADDLALINAMANMSGIASGFSRISVDPLSTMIALQQYPDVEQALVDVLNRVAQDYATAGVVFKTGDPGATFVNDIQNVISAYEASNGKTP